MVMFPDYRHLTRRVVGPEGQIGRGAPRRNSTKSYVGNTRLEKQKKEAHDVTMKTYRGLRRRGEQRHGAGVLRRFLRPLSVRGHGCFAERQYTDYKQRQTQPAHKKVKTMKSVSFFPRNLSLQIRNCKTRKSRSVDRQTMRCAQHGSFF